jgi:hypothetical protein
MKNENIRRPVPPPPPDRGLVITFAEHGRKCGRCGAESDLIHARHTKTDEHPQIAGMHILHFVGKCESCGQTWNYRVDRKAG